VNQQYLDTARLLTQVAPLIFDDDTFALKGGTAINLFFRDMPRLSVDLDLVFVDHRPEREEALAIINEKILDAAERLKKRGFQTHAPRVSGAGETKLLVRRDRLEVKVEVNFVLRGTVNPVHAASLRPKATDILLADLELPVVSLEDVYGGKLVAALDRQHPRDLFDVMQLFEHEGITTGIRRAFVVYLASHNRPIHEVLFPAHRDISAEYIGTFSGMTAEPVPLAALLSTRDRMIAELHAGLSPNEAEFLVSLARNQPKFELLDTPHLVDMPGIRWKMRNLEELARANPEKFDSQARQLEVALANPP
jgi:predicted nucleotidyltransferase component of viral defense system